MPVAVALAGNSTSTSSSISPCAAATTLPVFAQPAPPFPPPSQRAQVSLSLSVSREDASGFYPNPRPDLTNITSASQNNTNTTTNNGNTMQNSTQPPAGNLFGNNAASSNSLFGGAAGGLGSTATNSSNNMFNRNPPAPVAGSASSVFGNTMRSTPNTTGALGGSLLGAAQHSQMNQSTPFGRLSMGQNAATASNTVGAAKIDLDNLRPTTRFEDCVDQVKQEMEAIDKMIQEQEKLARDIEAFLPVHGEDVNSIAPDVTFITDKADDVEQALAADAQGVEAQRRNTEKDHKDVERCQRIITNLALPQGYQYSGMNSAYGSMYGQQRPQQPPANREEASNYDTDLIGNYFVPMAVELQKTMDSYASNLSEIESHMRVIESSAVAQAQQLAQRKAGVGGHTNGDATVRELADTLRGFEESILGVAGVVGECRDGVNDLVLGRVGGGLQ
jgi:nucleoporin p58/p45